MGNEPKPLSDKFNEAAKKTEPQQPQIGSEQVKNTKLGLQGGPQPPSLGAKNAAARQAHDAAKAKDAQPADKAKADYQAKLEKAKARNEATRLTRLFNEKSANMNNAQNKDNGPGR
jgi:hypothetical protein